MISKICDSYEFKTNAVVYRRDGKRYITFEYDVIKDKDILNQIKSILDKQPKCDNCINYQIGGYFCGYKSHECKIYGNIECHSHPMNDGDGSKCKNYKRNK